jgi:hypothetical protein
MSVKSSVITILFTLFASSAALANSPDVLRGTLEVNDSGVIFVNLADGGVNILRSGPITLKYSNLRPWSFVTGSRQIEIQQDDIVAPVYLDESNFLSFSNFTTNSGYDNGQIFELVGREANVSSSATYKTATASCSLPGKCTMCEFKNVDGILKNVCKLGLYDNCPGTQEVYGQVIKTSSTPVISVMQKSPAVELGKITGEPILSSSFKTIRAVSECKAE